MKNKYNHQLFFLHLEISTKCTLRCSRCTRTQQMGNFQVTQMSLDFIKENFTPELLNDEVHRILLCGGEGDPIYNSKFHEIISYFKETKPNIELVIVTNGSYRQPSWWEKTAEILNEHDSIVFSIDGWDNESNNKYRDGSNFDSAVKGLEIVREKGKCAIQWATILFKFNQHKIDDIKELAKEKGADRFSLTLSSLFGSNYETFLNEDGIDPIEPDAKYMSKYKGRHEKLYEILSDRKFPISTFNDISKQAYDRVLDEHKDDYILPLCKFGDRGLYVNSEGILFPCSWVSHPFGVRTSNIRDKRVEWKDHFWNKYKDDFDLKQHSLEDVLNTKTWEKLADTWKSKDTSFVECEKKCLKVVSTWEELKKKSVKQRFGNKVSDENK